MGATDANVAATGLPKPMVSELAYGAAAANVAGGAGTKDGVDADVAAVDAPSPLCCCCCNCCCCCCAN